MYYAACWLNFFHMCTAEMLPVPNGYSRRALLLWQMHDEAVRLHAAQYSFPMANFARRRGLLTCIRTSRVVVYRATAGSLRGQL